MSLTLQLHSEKHGWLDAATLVAVGAESVSLEYDLDYAATRMNARDGSALSVDYPVDLGVHRGTPPAFLFDLVPQGEPLKRVLQRYGLSDPKDWYAILATAPLAPPGNIRIKEPWVEIDKQREAYEHAGFTRADITERNRDFIDYMERSGAPIGGTSGAGGGSPKFMLREDRHGRLHAEGLLKDEKTVRSILVKLPYTDSENSRTLAHVEKIYYDILRSLPLNTSAPLEIEGETLFITRFDRLRHADGSLRYLGLESLYSAHGVSTYGARLRHEDNIELLSRISTVATEDILDYLKRDLVNQMLANTDNHGRNTSLIKSSGVVRLSPIYDVTAMQFFTGDIITELTTWDDPHRPLRARLEWLASATKIPYHQVSTSLKELGKHTRSLETQMRDGGVPQSIIERSRDRRQSAQGELESLP